MNKEQAYEMLVKLLPKTFNRKAHIIYFYYGDKYSLYPWFPTDKPIHLSPKEKNTRTILQLLRCAVLCGKCVVVMFDPYSGTALKDFVDESIICIELTKK